MKKKVSISFLILLLFLTFSNKLIAAPVSENTALHVAENFLTSHQLKPDVPKLKGTASIADFSVNKTDVITQDNTLLAYVLHLAPEGYIVVSPDTDIHPIIAYSYEGNFQMTESSENVIQNLVKWDMTSRIKHLAEFSDERKTINNQHWEDFLYQTQSIGVLNAVNEWGPLLSTYWDQGGIYDDLTPCLNSILGVCTNRASVGCVATAMAQIVYYWGEKYDTPSSLVFDGNDSYITDTENINIDGDAESRDFPDFSELNGMLSNIQYNGSDDEIAALNFACGISVEMDYIKKSWLWNSISGATQDNVVTALKNKFNYDTAETKNGNDPDFYDILKNNIKNDMPAQLWIYSNGDDGVVGGDDDLSHSIVADGFKDTGEYHLNFGWGDSQPDTPSEAWYFLPEGMPEGYNRIIEGVVNIYPGIVNRGLAWLKTQRNGSGYWDSSRGSVGVTAMATLAFLNAGYTEVDDVVSGGIDYLLANVHGDGSIYDNYSVYDTSLAILALKATYNPDYSDEIANAAEFLKNSQNTNLSSAYYGGWSYGPTTSSADLSNSQFAILGLSAAGEITQSVSSAFQAFLLACQNADGGFGYRPGSVSWGTTTAGGLWGLRLCGVQMTDPIVMNAVNWLSTHEDLSFDENPGGQARIAYYQLTFAKAMAFCYLDPTTGGQWYTDWYDKLRQQISEDQHADGYLSDQHGAVIDTCFSVLAIQTIQPPAADLWLSVILASPADLFVYDPQGRVCSQNECTIPGAFFEIDASGRQIVTLPELESGRYRMMISGTGDGLCHLTVNGYRGGVPGDPASAAEISSTNLEVMITENQVKTSDVLLSSIVGALTIDVEEPKETNLLNSGWQIISLRLQPDDTSITSVLESIEGSYESVWSYENGIWSVFNPANPGLSDLQNMSAGKGYWINMTSNTLSPSYSGTAPAKSVNLDAGWNLVGFNSESQLTISEALSSIDKQYKSVWAYVNGAWKFYDPAYPGFSNLTRMGPSQGFWINAREACTWTLP
jgi:hypothetical protein